MVKLKKIGFSGFLLLMCSVLFLLPSVTFAEEVGTDTLVQPMELTETQKESLRGLGFSEREINFITEEEYQRVAHLEGEIESQETKFYEVTVLADGESLINEVSKEQATRGAIKSKITKPGEIRPLATQTKNTSWMSLTITSSKLSNGNTYLHNSFFWLSAPAVGFKDVVSITHSASAVKIPDTENFVYRYTDGRGTHTNGAIQIQNSNQGTAAYFDLKVVGANTAPYDQEGYLNLQVKKGNTNDVSANAYGHYDHITIALTGTPSIGIKSGSISIGGVTKVTKATSPMILFNY